jgi:CRISPR-associated protein Cmr4
MNQENAVLGLLAETSIHAGTGQILGAVDLPIEREAHTGWPCVYGSGVKGALRALAYHRKLGDRDLEVVFGPDVGNASDHAGALAVSDARLLLLPVRSLDAAYRWVTCPAILERLTRDLRRVGVAGSTATIPKVPVDTAVVDNSATVDPARSGVFLEELRVGVRQEDLAELIEAIGPLIGDAVTRGHLAERLTLVDDVVFGDLVRSAAIPVTAHVKLKYETKTVDGGSLRYQESLPPDTVLYTVLSAFDGRRQEGSLTAEKVLAAITTTLFGERPYLQIGGNETVGMGWCRVASVAGGAS